MNPGKSMNHPAFDTQPTLLKRASSCLLNNLGAGHKASVSPIGIALRTQAHKEGIGQSGKGPKKGGGSPSGLRLRFSIFGGGSCLFPLLTLSSDHALLASPWITPLLWGNSSLGQSIKDLKGQDSPPPSTSFFPSDVSCPLPKCPALQKKPLIQIPPWLFNLKQEAARTIGVLYAPSSRYSWQWGFMGEMSELENS